MKSDNNEELAKRLCPHRGIGEENSLGAIQAGIETQPFFVEFDVQWHDDELYLGHPPDTTKGATLAQALNLFTESTTFPKIDVKLTNQTFQYALNKLVAELAAWSPRKALINISGELTAGQYMKAELLLVASTDEHTLLNIDLERYEGKSRAEVAAHLKQLSRKPFSISPNLDGNIAGAVSFAFDESIFHIHFWAFPDSKYPAQALHQIMRDCINSGLEVYFDIKAENIIESRPV